MDAETEAGAGLAAVLGGSVEGALYTDLLTRLLYATDASNYKIVPDAVLVARSVEDVQAAVIACHELEIPLTPRGAGTSLAGQAVGRGLHIDTYHLRGTVIDPDSHTAIVSCGTVQRDLDDEAAGFDLTFGPDTATADRATLGGMVGNNSAGTRSIVYGMTRDRLEAAEIVLADGSVATFGQTDGTMASGISGLPKAREAELVKLFDYVRTRAAPVVADRYPDILRHVDGYGLDVLCKERPNLAQFLAGSEGTLGVFTGFRVLLDDRPPERALAVLSFSRLEDALASVPSLLERNPSAVEMMDREALSGAPGYEELVAAEAEAVLYVEFQGEVGQANSALAKLPEDGALGVVRIEDPVRRQWAWDVRARGMGSTMGVGEPGTVPSFVEDTAVPPERLAEYVREVKRIVASHGTRTVMFGHASVGCLHMHPLVDLRTAAGVRDMEAMAGEIVELVRDFDGALSGEHGDGLSKSQWLERYFGPELVAAFRAVKKVFDPDGIMNPGKIVDPEPMTQNLRFGESYRVRTLRTPLDFSDFGGLAAATEKCFGAGACKKWDGGVMCPPAMVTGDERHTTRARANALRSVMNRDLPVEALSTPELKEIMGLCIACKACKTECPVGVDMARLKTDWLWRLRQEEGTSKRARMVANLRKISARASRFPRLTNRLARLGPVRGALIQRGFAPQRELPQFARKRFSKSVRASSQPSVAIFPDCFTEFQEPRLGRVLTYVLQAGGQGIVVPRVGCCGRVMLSQGFVEEARDAARHAADALLPLVEEGFPILFLEPSCLSAVKDDWQHLLPHDPAVERVARAARMAEEHVAELPLWLEEGGRVLLQGHCHQQSLWGTGASERALAMVPGTEVEVLDAGCCGMAGAFGYEAEHYEMSVAIGERALAPAVRDNPDATIVTPGTSCRHQVRDLTGREAIHPIEYVARHLRALR